MEHFQTFPHPVKQPVQQEAFITLYNGACVHNTSDLLLNETDDSFHITIPYNTHVSSRIYIVHVLDKPPVRPESWVATHIHSLERSRATIFEVYYLMHAKNQTPYNIRTLTEYDLSQNSALEHYLFYQSGAADAVYNTLNIHQAQNSQYTGTLLQASAGQQHTELALHLNEANAEATIRALTLASETQNKTLNIVTQHHAPHCTSHTTTRGIANGLAKSHFTGSIIVDPAAKKTYASLDAKQLLLSEKALAHIKPELEIYHQDVQCTHGATVGYLDEEALFYLKSRGISELEAKKLLVNAFMQSIVQHIPPNDFTKAFQATHGY